MHAGTFATARYCAACQDQSFTAPQTGSLPIARPSFDGWGFLPSTSFTAAFTFLLKRPFPAPSLPG